eukprot:TRINITY_DN39747_c0_g1_i1.p1 TRINITY_DN39747_c0_g1~~TRINITY_DN39747_c0_g1_i1.p1  ORF type:complete len:161 (-),score=48.52 TRINITY_DN39747_c0_g1_i1:52-474(-)
MVEIYIPAKGICGRLEPPCRSDDDELPDDLEALMDIEALELRQIHHLERSNVELLELLECEEDKDFREAVDENRHVLRRKGQRLAAVQERIKQIRLAQQSVSVDASAEYKGSSKGGYVAGTPAAPPPEVIDNKIKGGLDL